MCLDDHCRREYTAIEALTVPVAGVAPDVEIRSVLTQEIRDASRWGIARITLRSLPLASGAAMAQVSIVYAGSLVAGPFLLLPSPVGAALLLNPADYPLPESWDGSSAVRVRGLGTVGDDELAHIEIAWRAL